MPLHLGHCHWLSQRRPAGLAPATATLALAIVAAACGGSASETAPAVRAPVPVRVALVTRGPIAANLSYSGEIQAADVVDLIPSAAGRLMELFVEEGQGVAAGTELARLETDVLEAQARQAAANVASAQARLETVLQGARPEDIAAAAAAVGSAETRLADIRAGTKAAELAATQAAADTAEANLAGAEARLSLLRNPTELDILAAQATLDSAKASLESAEARLDDLKKSPKAADVAAARATVAAAEAAYRTSESSLADIRQPLQEERLIRLIEAYRNVNIANEKYEADKARGAPPEVLRADEDAINLAYRRLDLARRDANTFNAGVSAEKIAATTAAVAAARANLASAEARLKQLLDGPTQAELQAAHAAVDTAEAAVRTAQTRLDRLKAPTAADIATAEAAVATAAASLRSASARLDQQRAGATAAEMEAARAAVAAAEATLARTRTPSTETDINAAAAAVAQAQAAHDLARIQLGRATLLAPFDAIVARKFLSRGAQVGAQTPVLNLVSKTAQVVFNVEEGAIGRLRENQQVTFQVTAFAGRTFRGRLTSISPTADAASRTFRIKVTPDANQESLRAGMFANVSVAVESRTNVLLVPQEAVVQRGADSFVYVVSGDQSEQKKVEIGLRNERFAEIRSGIEEGNQVVTRGNRTLQQTDKVTVIQQ